MKLGEKEKLIIGPTYDYDDQNVSEFIPPKETLTLAIQLESDCTKYETTKFPELEKIYLNFVQNELRMINDY